MVKSTQTSASKPTKSALSVKTGTPSTSFSVANGSSKAAKVNSSSPLTISTAVEPILPLNPATITLIDMLFFLSIDLNHRQAPSQMDSTYLVNLGVRPNTSAPSPKCVAITAHKDTTVETLIPCASSCLLKSSAFSGAFV